MTIVIAHTSKAQTRRCCQQSVIETQICENPIPLAYMGRFYVINPDILCHVF